MTVTDDTAERVLLAALNLAIVIRDEGPDAVTRAARAVLAAAEGDPIAAICCAAIAIDPDLPLYRFWQEDEPRKLRPCGTRAAYVRHRRHGETPCAACKTAHSRHVVAAKKRRRQLQVVAA